jgi:SAM-dependent methyltransferase
VVDYALALSDDELARYRRMAELAHDDEAQLWTLAGVREGAMVADVGCGPGAVSALLARLVGPQGHVSAVDASAEALAAARATFEASGVTNVTCAPGDAADTGLEPGSFDVVMMRHVLAHNATDEQRIVDHLATLVRPGGSVYLVDNDGTAVRRWPPEPDLDDLLARYQAFHAQRGNDLMVGIRLGELLANAGLEVVAHDGRYVVLSSSDQSGIRGPGWAARDVLVPEGWAQPSDVDRWAAAHERLDRGELEFKVFVPMFCAVGRRPG